MYQSLVTVERSPRNVLKSVLTHIQVREKCQVCRYCWKVVVAERQMRQFFGRKNLIFYPRQRASVEVDFSQGRQGTECSCFQNLIRDPRCCNDITCQHELVQLVEISEKRKPRSEIHFARGKGQLLQRVFHIQKRVVLDNDASVFTQIQRNDLHVALKVRSFDSRQAHSFQGQMHWQMVLSQIPQVRYSRHVFGVATIHNEDVHCLLAHTDVSTNISEFDTRKVKYQKNNDQKGFHASIILFPASGN